MTYVAAVMSDDSLKISRFCSEERHPGAALRLREVHQHNPSLRDGAAGVRNSSLCVLIGKILAFRILTELFNLSHGSWGW